MSKNSLIINLGSSHVSFFHYEIKKGTVLKKVSLNEIQGDLNSEENWFSEIDRILQSVSLKGIPKTNAKIILPSSKLLTKTLRVPKVEQEKQRKVVSFELSQKLPFPLESLIWDFQVIDDDGIEQEIICIAIKPDIISNICRILYSKKIIPSKICPGSLLDHISINRLEENTQKDILFINFGAKTTNLIFKNTSGFLVRTLNIGQHTFTENIATTFSITTEKAERIKRDYTRSDKTNSSTEESFQILKNVANNFYAKIMQEISRGLVSYKRLKRGKQPTEIIASGRGVQDGEFISLLSSSQKLPVSYFNPYNYISDLAEIDEENVALLPFISSESLGMLLLTEEHNKSSQIVNLLPAKKIDELQRRKKIPYYIASSFLFALFPISPYLQEIENLEIIKKELLQIEERINHSKELIDKRKNIENELNVYNKINEKGLNFTERFLSLGSKVHNKVKVIDGLQSLIADNNLTDVWLDEVHFIYNKDALGSATLKMDGRYLVRPSFDSLESNNLKLSLIEENSNKAESLTSMINELFFVRKIKSKTFSTEGKGDLFNRNFTHFSFLLELK